MNRYSFWGLKVDMTDFYIKVYIYDYFKILTRLLLKIKNKINTSFFVTTNCCLPVRETGWGYYLAFLLTLWWSIESYLTSNAPVFGGIICFFTSGGLNDENLRGCCILCWRTWGTIGSSW